MRKSAAKLAAALLSAALVVTSVTVPGTESSAASTVKISAKKATLYTKVPTANKIKKYIFIQQSLDKYSNLSSAFRFYIWSFPRQEA